jgi:hypothetical protein
MDLSLFIIHSFSRFAAVGPGSGADRSSESCRSWGQVHSITIEYISRLLPPTPEVYIKKSVESFFSYSSSSPVGEQ